MVSSSRSSLLLASVLAATSACAASSGGSSESPSAGASPTVGQDAPSLAVTGQEGPDIADLAGKVVIVDFWASWCTPCKEELPELEQLYAELGGSGLEIIGVSVDEERTDMERFLETMPLSFPVVFDASHEIAQRWNPPKMPTSYVIDKTGKIAHVQEGFRQGDADVIRGKVNELLR